MTDEKRGLAMHHAFKIGDTEINVELSRAREGYRLHIGDQVVPVDLKTGADGHCWLTVDGELHEVVIATRGDDIFIHVDGETHQLTYEHPLERLAHQAGGGAADSVRAPMPGSLVSIAVKAGDTVTKGQTLLVMESMKMETTIMSPRDGVVAVVNFEKGQQFERDAVLLTLEKQS
jgi:acetyl/propionyl-CoA carboxylase alpha subunit